MPPDARVLVERGKGVVQDGLRELAREALAPGWRVERGSAVLEVGGGPEDLDRPVSWQVRLRVHAGRASRRLVLEVPELRLQPSDAGAERFAPDWALESVSDEGRPPPQVRVTDDDAAAVYAWRPGRRLVELVWPEEVPPGAVRTLALRWRQRVPLARVDTLRGGILRFGDASPPMPLFPLPVGDPGAFAWGATVVSDPTLEVAGGRPEGDQIGAGGQRVRRVGGEAGGAAALAIGRWKVDRAGGVAVYSEASAPGSARAALRVARPLLTWSGRPLAALGLAQLPAAVRPAVALWAEGFAGIQPSALPEGYAAFVDGEQTRLPEVDTVLAAEGLAGASWARLAGADREAQGWLGALARAFAVEVLPAAQGRVWRAWLNDCSARTVGTNPGLSPYAAARSGFRELSTRCGAPLIVGPMLDDRLGPERARALRRRWLSEGRLDLGGMVAAYREADPEGEAWARRWLAGGQRAHVEVLVEGLRALEGGRWRATGTLRSDFPLAGAPVTVELRAGKARQRLHIEAGEREVPFSVDLDFRPRAVVVDPDQRLLAESGGDVLAGAAAGP